MPCAHQPRLEIDVTVVVEVGIAPLGVFIVGNIVLDDTNHVFRAQYIGFIKVTHITDFIAYPIPGAATVKQLAIDEFRKFIANVVVHIDYCIAIHSRMLYAR